MKKDRVPIFNVGIVQISPVHRIETIIADLNDNSNDTSMELAEEETKTGEVQRTKQSSIQVEHALSGSKSGPVQVVFQYNIRWSCGPIVSVFIRSSHTKRVKY